MKKVLLFILLIFGSFASAQTKQQLIDSIISFNKLHSDCVYASCTKSRQYLNFEKLKTKISKRELLELSNHENPALRMFAIRECLLTGKGDAGAILFNEFKRNEVVTELDGCIEGDEHTYNLVYHDYWNKIRIEARDATKTDDQKIISQAMAERVRTDATMTQLDSLVLAQEDTYWLLYARAFSNRKFPDSYLQRIEKLAFTHHNMYALDHLQQHYSEKYKKQIDGYWHKDFPTAKFDGENGVYHYNVAIELLLESASEAFKQLAMNKLKADRSWEVNEAWFETTLERYGYSLSDIEK